LDSLRNARGGNQIMSEEEEEMQNEYLEELYREELETQNQYIRETR